MAQDYNLKPRKQRTFSYGWKKGPVRPIDNFYTAPHGMVALPESVDLSENMAQKWPPYNQGQLGSCTANASAGLAQYIMIKNGLGNYVPSRLAIYWWERFKDHDVDEDAGSSLQQAANVISTYGIPNETLWPYVDTCSTCGNGPGTQFEVKPTKNIWSDGWNHCVAPCMAVPQDLNSIKSCLAEGNPIMFGFVVLSSFESEEVAETGIMPMPQRGDQICGGHAVLACGYNNQTQMVKVRNSWGADWGKDGYFFMPYEYAIHPQLASDFWTASDYVRFGK